MPTPNILLFITHDTGRHLGSYGRGVATPNLDRLAREGVLFEQCFCAAPQCSPSRAGLITGRMPHNHGLIGLTHRGFRLREDVPTLPQLVQKAGYSTYLFGHQHESPDGHALGYQTIKVGQKPPFSCLTVTPLVIEFLAQRPPEPFFAVVGVTETHRPYPATEGPLDAVKVPAYLPDEAMVRRDVANLNGLVERADGSIGRILRALDETDLAENTLFIYTTDHGIAFPGAKATLFDPGIEIALIARWPGGFLGGQRIPGTVSNIDILPTLLSLWEQPIPEGVEGVNLAPLVLGEAGQVREHLFVEQTFHAAYDPVRGVRTERYKYIRSFEKRPYSFPPNVDPGPTKDFLRDRGYFERQRPQELLFDLQADPLEQRNLVDDPACADVLVALRDQVLRKMREDDDLLLHGPAPVPPGAYVTPPESYEPK
jgi:arylsulfatase A-like enzyme